MIAGTVADDGWRARAAGPVLRLPLQRQPAGGTVEAGPERLGVFCVSGCSDSREVWISFASMLAAFNASSTLPIAALLASEASRAVLGSEVQPPSISAISGGTDTVASPLTEIMAGRSICASAGVASSMAAT